MEKFKNIVRFIISMLLSILSVFLCGFVYLNDGSVQIWNSETLQENVSAPPVAQAPSQTITQTEEPPKEEITPKQENSSSAQETVTVSTDSQTAIGKITPQFISSNNSPINIK